MSVAAGTHPQWQERLSSAGLPDVTALLVRNPRELRVAGELLLLGKPRLGGRERWRWRLPDGSIVFIKRYASPTLREQWDRGVRQSALRGRAAWEYARAVELHEASVPAPRPVAFADSRSGPLERAGVVLLASVAGEPLDVVWQRVDADRTPLTFGLARQDFATRLGRFIAAFHGTGLCHRDLYLCHVFAQVDPDGRVPPRFALIDLGRSFRPRLRRARWIVKDLAQLDSAARSCGASRSDRLRCLIAYLGLQPGAPRIRWYVRQVVRKSDWIIRRAQRKGQRIVPALTGSAAGAPHATRLANATG